LFGFVIPDDPLRAGGASEVWVHRTSIDTPYSFDEFANRPYLLKGERVRFKIIPSDDKNDNPRASDLKFENGRQIPLFRKK
jgi:hypothetical protein